MTNTLQKRYEGFLETPCLWHGDRIYNLNQLEIPLQSDKITEVIDNNLRLGKYIERLVTFQLSQQPNISVVAENIQIQNNKITLGELDAIILKDNQPIHLEIVYKFYVYVPNRGSSDIDCCIGPNKKDTLKEKLIKLKEKQLPLLYSKFCRPYLEEHNLKAQDITQQVYFKAQLFMPFNVDNISLTELNSHCITGIYLNRKELTAFSDCKFYIPNKKDWLLVPHPHVDWLNYKTMLSIAETFYRSQYSPLLWIKSSNGATQKAFLIWW